MTLLDAIPLGREHALTKREIALRLGVSTRDIEHGIEELRKTGAAAICSDSQVGYWRPLTAEELAENIERRRRRAISQLTTVRGERKCLREWRARVVEQGTLWAA